MDYIKLLRPKQWLKNFFVFAALLFSRNLFDPLMLGETVAAFGFFCLLSSSLYILNDINDRERDRSHPVKRERPIAAGRIAVPVAYGYSAALLLLSLGLALAIKPLLGLVGVIYALLMVTIPFIIYGLFRYLYVIYQASGGGAPEEVLASDRPLQVDILIWIIACFVILYFFKTPAHSVVTFNW